MMRVLKISAGLGAIWLTSACAGPSTPFGASLQQSLGQPPHSLSLPDESNPARGLASETRVIKWRVTPDRPVLHGSHTLKMELYDPRGIAEDYTLKAYYNGYDLSYSFRLHSQAEVSADRKVLHLTYPDLYLPADQQNQIIWAYQRNSRDSLQWLEYRQPECEITQPRTPASLKPFGPPANLVDTITQISTTQGYNPTFFMALIGQESGFNPSAVSHAMAVGLTQITPLAASEVNSFFPEWTFLIPPTSSHRELRSMIASGAWSRDKDWRLDPEKNLLGSLKYLETIKAYWRRQDHADLLKRHQLWNAKDMTQLLLASYNSGSFRVKGAIHRHGPSYLWKDPQLKEARTYVQKIKSYCHHFGSEP